MYIVVESDITQDLINKIMFVPSLEVSIYSSRGGMHRLKAIPVQHVTGPITNWVLEITPCGREILHTSISKLNGDITGDSFAKAVIDKLVYRGHLSYTDLHTLAIKQGNGSMQDMKVIVNMAINLNIYSKYVCRV